MLPMLAALVIREDRARRWPLTPRSPGKERTGVPLSQDGGGARVVLCRGARRYAGRDGRGDVDVRAVPTSAIDGEPHNAVVFFFSASP